MKVTVLAEGQHYVPILMNWYEHFKEVTDSEVLVRGDPDNLKEIAQHGVKVLPLRCTNPTPNFHTVMRNKMNNWMDLLESEGEILVCDADAIWVKDIMPMMRNLHETYDGVFSTARHIKSYPPNVRRMAGFTVCGGFFSLNDGPGVQHLLSDVMSRYQKDFQHTVNNLLFTDSGYHIEGAKDLDEGFAVHFPKYDIRLKMLGERDVWRGRRRLSEVRRLRDCRDRIYIHHPVTQHSVDRVIRNLKLHGLWKLK